jgi:hypothetical protein
MASRNPVTGDNWTKKEEEEFNIAEFEKNLARFESMTPKELGSTGPQHAGMGTLFSPDRWQAYIDWLIKAGMEAEAKILEEAVTTKTETEVLPKELYWDEDATDEEIASDVKEFDEGGPYVESDPADALIDSRDKRGLKGERSADGSLLSQEDKDLTTKIRADQEKYKDELTDNPLSIERAQKTRDTNVEAIKDKYATAKEERLKENGVDIEQEDSIENWMTNFESMSDEQFESIKFEDLAQYGANAEDAYTEVKLSKDKSDDEFTDAQMDAAESDRESMEMGAEFDAEIAQDQADEDQLTDADAERIMMEATADADKLDADYEASEFPMMGMSDKDKGMFSFKKTESKDDKNIQEGIGVITQDTGMNEEQARQLMTKLKGICG